MRIKPIHTEEDHRQVLAEIETLMDAEADSEEGERLDLLVTLVEAIKFHMERRGMTSKDLQPMIERLNRVRPLTLSMIRKLHSQLGIPAESLIKYG
ncbi:MAG TPA: transcriptional regulator [Desulfobulbaceae bacterium]|nr:transcriptional regulator [Desulfobulbaceae bacterium]